MLGVFLFLTNTLLQWKYQQVQPHDIREERKWTPQKIKVCGGSLIYRDEFNWNFLFTISPKFKSHNTMSVNSYARSIGIA